jgi:hypothetical protein
VVRRARWGRCIATLLQVGYLLEGGHGVLRRFGNVGWFPGCFGGRGSKLVVHKLLLDLNVFLGGVTFPNGAVTSLKAVVASEPGGSAAGHANMMPVGAEQVNALIAFCTVVQMVPFVPTMFADRTEASRKRLVDATV